MPSHESGPIPRIIALIIVLALGGIACSLTDQFISIATATPQPDSSQIPLTNPATSTNSQPGTAPATTSAQASATVEHQTRPAEPGPPMSTINDRSSQTESSVGSASAEAWRSNTLERPFQRQSMLYQPEIDLAQASLSLSDQWLYADLKVHAAPSSDGEALYGIELDLDIDGRGDLLVAARSPNTPQWTTAGVVVWRDANGDVGGPNASRADGPNGGGDGYEQNEFDSGAGTDPDLAWSRQNLTDPTIVQLALKRSALAGQASFAWRPFTDGQLQDPSLFDYHDYFSLAEAGSPVIDSGNYPLKEFGSFDNSCAWAVGFTPNGSEPGMCPPPATATPEASPTPEPGAIYGLVWWDEDRDQAKDSGEPPESNLTIRLGVGACPASGFASTTTSYISYSANFRFSQLPPGTYCVSFNHKATITTYNNPATVQVSPGAETAVNFGLYLDSIGQ